jgi:hypothetical protein
MLERALANALGHQVNSSRAATVAIIEITNHRSPEDETHTSTPRYLQRGAPVRREMNSSLTQLTGWWIPAT